MAKAQATGNKAKGEYQKGIDKLIRKKLDIVAAMAVVHLMDQAGVDYAMTSLRSREPIFPHQLICTGRPPAQSYITVNLYRS